MSNPVFERFRGDTDPIRITIRDDSGAVVPLTTEAFQLSVSSTENPTVAPDILTVAGTITDAPNGKVSFAIDGTQSIGNYFYDIQMTNTDSTIKTIAKNTFLIKQDITK